MLRTSPAFERLTDGGECDNRCDEGWVGKECGVAVCDTEGCLNGECVAPDECVCFSGWGANNCTVDQLTKEAAKTYLDGLMVKVRKLPALVVHKNEEGYRDSWKCVFSASSLPYPNPRCCSATATMTRR